MMGEKKLSEVKAEVAALLKQLPGKSPREWFRKAIKETKRDGSGDVETLEMLCAALEEGAKKRRKKKVARKASKS
jgi:hypothetical protein